MDKIETCRRSALAAMPASSPTMARPRLTLGRRTLEAQGQQDRLYSGAAEIFGVWGGALVRLGLRATRHGVLIQREPPREAPSCHFGAVTVSVFAAAPALGARPRRLARNAVGRHRDDVLGRGNYHLSSSGDEALPFLRRRWVVSWKRGVSRSLFVCVALEPDRDARAAPFRWGEIRFESQRGLTRGWPPRPLPLDVRTVRLTQAKLRARIRSGSPADLTSRSNSRRMHPGNRRPTGLRLTQRHRSRV